MNEPGYKTILFHPLEWDAAENEWLPAKREILLWAWENGRYELAERDEHGQTWGPPTKGQVL